MQYKYRHFYAIAISMIIIVLGCLYDIQPTLTQLSQLKKTETQLRQQLSTVKSVVTEDERNDLISSQYTHQTDFLSDLLVLAQLSGLIVKSVHFTLPQQFIADDATIIHMLAQANFREIVSFLFSLDKQATPIAILDFFYQSAEQNTFLFTMDMLFLKDHMKLIRMDGQQEHFLHMHNPFCFSFHPDVLKDQYEVAKWRSSPLEQIKMIGYLEQGERSQGLLLLPNHAVVAIRPGDVIGKEQGTVTAVQNDRILIALPKNKLSVIKR